MLSINRFVKHTVELADAFGIDVLVSGVPLKNPPVDYTGFRAVRPMVSFNTIVARTQPDRLILHIPEVCTQDFVEGLKEHHLRWLKSIPRLQINIMNQNNELMPDPLYVEKCRDITDEVTITAAHLGYATQDLADNYDCPVGLLTPFLPEFDRTDFEKKEKTIVLSPDDSLPPGGVTKERVLNMIARELPDYKTIVIENMKFDVYRKTISSARFAITFGEGYDGYFLEPFLCDSVAFAVYNETFFPSEFADLPTIYTSWESLYDNLAADIRRLEAHADEYRRVQAVTEKLIRRYTSREISWRNLVDFYRRKFTFLPKIYRDSALFANDSDPMDGRKQGLVNE
ncbi:MAG: hypothetical protein GY849_16100 [Deltaproteobacteria bacterium]|nr:hypothetical protein [Deltaproteobacteria bacterium]